MGRRIGIAICATAFALRLTAFLALGRATRPDVWESETIATNLLSGRGYVYEFLGATYRSYMEPLYPGLCAAVYALTGHSYLALGLVQAVLGTALVALVLACGRKVGGERAAFWAAGLAAVHPGLIAYTTKFHPFVLDSLLVLLVLAGCLFWSDQRPWRSALGLGAALGLCTLSRATILVCAPIVAWWVWRRDRARPARARLGRLALVAGAAALLIAPWVARNHAVHQRFMLTRSGTSLVFWLGNNPHRFTGSAATPTGEALHQLLPPEQQARLRTLDELGQQDFFLAEARDFVRAHPLAFVQRWLTKLGYFWWQSPQAGRLYPAAWFRAYQAYYLLVAALAIAGAAAHRRRPETWLVAGLCLAISLLQSAYYVEGRHRLALEPLLLLLAGAGAAQLLPWGKKVSS
jgi:4-amino-4-deoxy-L-arabinose transferase-like glycosyltransferase